MTMADEKTIEQIVSGLSADLKRTRELVDGLGREGERYKRAAVTASGRVDRLAADLKLVGGQVDSLRDVAKAEIEQINETLTSLANTVATLAAAAEDDDDERVSWMALRG